MTIRVVVADDHPMFLEGLTAALETLPDLKVIAQAGTGNAAEAAVTQHRPDVAVVDLRMPDGDGLSAIRAIRRASPATRILVLTSFDGSDDVAAALAAGAHGYLVKTADPDEIAGAVRAVAVGAAVVSDDILASLATRAGRRGENLFPELTGRETDVLRELSRGLSVEGTAAALGLTPKTVRNHVATITAKLGVRDRTAAVLVGRNRGLDAAAHGSPTAIAPDIDQ